MDPNKKLSIDLMMRPLIPKEHGAYGQLGLPLLAALAMGRPTWVGGCLVIAGFAAFAAHEPLLVLLGKRGPRARRQLWNRAWTSSVGWMLLALAAGISGFWLGGAPVVRASLFPFGLGLIMIPFVLRGHEKTLVGESIAAATLAAAAIPVTVSVGLNLDRALFVWGMWMIGFAASIAAVRWVISVQKKRPARGELLMAITATLAAAALTTQSWVALAAAPYLLLSWILIARPPSARYLRRVGWTLMLAGVLTALTAIALARMA